MKKGIYVGEPRKVPEYSGGSKYLVTVYSYIIFINSERVIYFSSSEIWGWNDKILEREFDCVGKLRSDGLSQFLQFYDTYTSKRYVMEIIDLSDAIEVKNAWHSDLVGIYKYVGPG